MARRTKAHRGWIGRERGRSLPTIIIEVRGELDDMPKRRHGRGLEDYGVPFRYLQTGYHGYLNPCGEWWVFLRPAQRWEDLQLVWSEPPSDERWIAHRRSQLEKLLDKRDDARQTRRDAKLLHGGLRQVGSRFVKSFDGYKNYQIEEIKPYTDLRYEWSLTKILTPQLIKRFYRLWSDASGYGNSFCEG